MAPHGPLRRKLLLACRRSQSADASKHRRAFVHVVHKERVCFTRSGGCKCAAAAVALAGPSIRERRSMATRLDAATPAVGGEQSDLQRLTRQHLWMHFTRMSAYEDHEMPIIVRGDGCYVYDQHGKRYLDGLSALFCVNAGHGRTEIGEAAAKQVEELAFFTNWSYAHPRAIELAARIANLAPGDLNRVFFTSGGSEAVESALKMCRNYHRLRGDGQRYKLIAREIAYHGTTMGCLSGTGIPGLRAPFEPLTPPPGFRGLGPPIDPLTPGACHAPTTNSYLLPEYRHPPWAPDDTEERIIFE